MRRDLIQSLLSIKMLASRHQPGFKVFEINHFPDFLSLCAFG
jgi:hypothetical protein